MILLFMMGKGLSGGQVLFLFFLLKSYVVSSCLNCLDETVQMRGHNI